MTHSLYRQGAYESLTDDFVVLTSPAMPFDDLPARIERFREIGFRHNAVNTPGVMSSASGRHLVYDSREKLCGCLQDLSRANLGMSVLVSGLRDKVGECCQEAGLTPHTVNQSLGFWGRTEKLPAFPVLEITTMCGHGRVAPNLVWNMADRVLRGGGDVKEAARSMGKLCLCNIFNEIRAARLLKKLAVDLQAGLISRPGVPETAVAGSRKNFGITIDETRCTRCLECLPDCPTEAIGASAGGKTVLIDAERCTECGLCRQAEICPVDAISGQDLTWPRSLRGKFQHPYAPYRSAPTLAKSCPPVSYGKETGALNRRAWPSEHHNDVSGRILQGEAMLVIELGRPHLGATFSDVQKVAQAMVPLGLNLRRQYPAADERSALSDIALDSATGLLLPETLAEKAGWVVLKMLLPEQKIPEAVRQLGKAAAEIDTVFALGLVSRTAGDGTTAAERVACETGVAPAVNCKTNVGLGRPLARD